MKRLSRYLREVQEFDSNMENLNELFIQAAELNNMPEGRDRDMQLLRLATIAEYDAANLYEMMARLSSIPELAELFRDIAKEEKVHVGEFEFALKQIDPDQEESDEKGEDEAEDITGWDEDKGVKESHLVENPVKQKMKELKKANQMRCKSIAIEIKKRRDGIKALLLQARQWDCGE